MNILCHVYLHKIYTFNIYTYYVFMRISSLSSSVPSFFSVGEIQWAQVCLENSWILWGHTMSVNLDTSLGFKSPIFLSVGPEGGHLSSCLKIHPIDVFSLLTALTLFQPLGYFKEVDGSQLLTAGPFHLHWNVASTRCYSMGPSTFRHTLVACFFMSSHGVA